MEAQRLKTARRRQAWLFVGLLLFGVRLGWALVDIQVLSHRDYTSAAQRQQKKRVVISPQRGTIYDRHGVPLAVNKEQYEIYLVPRHIVDVDRFVERFREIVDVEENELRERIAEGGWYVRLIRGVSRETVRQLESASMEGVGVRSHYVRHYPYGDLAHTILGRVDVDNIGIEGIELQYEEALHGKPGYATHQRDALGREYPNFTYPVEPPVDGHDIHLTIDLGLQEIVEGALDAAMTKTRAKTGSAMVIDPDTGELLAVANSSAALTSKEGALTNHAVVDQFEPGSTFKVISLAGLYELGLVAPSDSIFCENGVWNYNGRTIRDVHPYGFLTVEEVIEESSNICSAKLTAKLGEERVYEYARRFGFGLPTGLDFPGEPRGLLKRPDQWSALTSASIAMGYEVMATSVQMAMAYGSIANGGELMRPYLVRKIIDPKQDVVFEGSPQTVRRVMRSETADLITQALVRVVEVGTAQTAQIGVLPVAGKTGTAIKMGTRGYDRSRHASSFAGFFPATDARYVMFVRIDEPVGAYYGGLVAAPVFRDVVKNTLLTETLADSPTLVGRFRAPNRVVWTVADEFGELPPPPPDSLSLDEDQSIAATAARWEPVTKLPKETAPAQGRNHIVEVDPADGPAEVAFDPIKQVKVPDFSGLSLRESIRRSSELSLRLEFTGTGRVVNQEPEPGEVVPRGATILVRNR